MMKRFLIALATLAVLAPTTTALAVEVDTEPPSVTCPDETVFVQRPVGLNVMITPESVGVSATDNVGVTGLFLTPNNFSADLFFPGVRAIAFDAAGNEGECTFDVLVFSQVDTDGDGVFDDVDPFPNSNLDPTVGIDGRDTGVTNQSLGDGSTFNDRIGACASDATDHAMFVSCVDALAEAWVDDGLIAGRDKGRIMRAAAKSSIGK